MAASIVPGYTFTATETPTAAKLLLQATGLQITGLGLDALPGELIAKLSGNVSGASGASMPSEGFLWIDPANNLWVEQRWTRVNSDSGPTEVVGATQLFRPSEGGWMTRRLYRSNDLLTFPTGEWVRTNQTRSLSASELAVGMQDWITINNGQNNPLSDGGHCLGFQDESSVSGSRPHIVGRGTAQVQVNQPYADHQGSFHQMTRFGANTSAAELFVVYSTSTGTHNRHQGHDVGKHWRRGSDAVGVGKAAIWLFSHPAIGNNAS